MLNNGGVFGTERQTWPFRSTRQNVGCVALFKRTIATQPRKRCVEKLDAPDVLDFPFAIFTICPNIEDIFCGCSPKRPRLQI